MDLAKFIIEEAEKKAIVEHKNIVENKLKSFMQIRMICTGFEECLSFKTVNEHFYFNYKSIFIKISTNEEDLIYAMVFKVILRMIDNIKTKVINLENGEATITYNLEHQGNKIFDNGYISIDNNSYDTDIHRIWDDYIDVIRRFDQFDISTIT